MDSKEPVIVAVSGEAEEPTGNNLSFPVIWADGSLLVPGAPEQFKLSVPYDGDNDGTPDIYNHPDFGDYWAFAQKVVGNEWQAASIDLSDTEGPVYVTEIDWGDSLEGTRPIQVNRPVRIELTFFKDLTADDYSDEPIELRDVDELIGLPMTPLANPSSPDEIQGAGGKTTGEGDLPDDNVWWQYYEEASVYAGDVTLVVQKYANDADPDSFSWTGDQWTGEGLEDPIEGLSFGSELNVGGKVIYGLSMGGWRPSTTGKYRITVDLPDTGATQLDYAEIRASEEEEEASALAVLAEDEGPPAAGDPLPAGVDGENNLTFIDILVVGGGGGGGGGNGGNGGDGGGQGGPPTQRPPFSPGEESTTITGDEQDNLLEGTPLTDYLSGREGNDTLLGMDSNDFLIGDEGDDVISGGSGDDNVFGDDGADFLNGNRGNDVLLGGDGNDVVRGGKGNDFLNGSAGNDFLSGDEGDDLLRGGRGDDTLNGNSGNDDLYGDRGADFFLLSKGNDFIADFSIVEGDTIGILAGQAYTLAQSGDNLLISRDQSITTLASVDLAAFEAANVIVMV